MTLRDGQSKSDDMIFLFFILNEFKYEDVIPIFRRSSSEGSRGKIRIDAFYAVSVLFCCSCIVMFFAVLLSLSMIAMIVMFCMPL